MNERDLFLSALEIEDPAGRRAHLQSACADNAELLIRVESLLASHEGESRFLHTPVVEQLGEDPTGQIAPTIVMGTGSTQDEEPHGDDSAASLLEFSQSQERVKMADEIPLGYLEPSTRPGSLGRLAHYEILEVVGQGAFGTVLRAFDEKLQRVVAIKVMAPELAATSPARKRFVREAQSSAQIRHENVVSVYAVEEKPLPYLVMEYIPGVTLQQRLDEKGPLDVPTVLRLGTQIAEGLAAAHAKDLIHRDVKPGNILLESGMRDRVKITDFGLARAADDASMTQSGTIAGTPMYMAPEQALGKKLDQRADLFSFGSVLYQMVSGRPPFRASSTLAVLKRLTEDTPRSIREIIPESPTWLCDIITKLHAKNPDERYQSAREIADVLANCEAQLKEHSRLKDLSLIPRAKAQPAGWWKWLATAALLLLILAIGLYTFTRPGSQPVVTGNGTEPSISVPTPISVAKQKSPPAAIAPFDSAQARAHQEAWAKHLGAPVEYTNSIGMKLRLIPPGEFMMGSSPDEKGFAHSRSFDWYKKYIESEGPLRRTRIERPFALGVREVTVGEFRQFVDATGYVTECEQGGKGGWKHSSTTNKMEQDKEYTWRNTTFAASNDHPVVFVSLKDAQAFCAWLSQQESCQYVLPTEAQWEYACRAGSQSAWHWGADSTQGAAHCWSDSNSGGTSHQVGGKQPNPFGLYDMAGNVIEIGLDEQQKPASRGGSYMLWWSNMRSAARIPDDTECPAAVDRGFRIALVGDLKPALEAPQRILPSTFTNGIGMEFVLVPKGKSWLWGGTGKLGTKEVEIPADFYLGKYEVTQEEWEKVMGENPSHFSRTGEGKDGVQNINDAQLKRFPVENVSWDDCQIFVAKLNKQEKETGWVYRLPTEVEWEYACRCGPMSDRADSAFDFYFAKPTNTLLPEQANIYDKGLTRTCKVGSYEANVLGLYDVYGNVREWCADTHQAPDASHRVNRGGGWDFGSVDCRTADRRSDPPSWVAANLGLRLARVPSGAASPAAKTPLATARFALAFDGQKSRVKIPSLRITEAHPLTAEAWIVIEDREDRHTHFDLLGNSHELQGFALGIAPGQDTSGEAKWAFSIRSKSPDTYVRTWEKQPVPPKQLIHVAGVYDGKEEVRLYVNGQVQSRTPIKDVKPSTLSTMRLGADSNYKNWFLGRMNGVRISKVARYDNDFTPDNRWMPDSDTIALFHFDEGQGTVLKDSSGNGHHGEVVGAKWVKADGSPIGSVRSFAPLPPTFKNTLGMEFVLVPKGKSWLGGGKDKLGDKEVEIPADFYLGKYEVTQEEWHKVMGENPSHFSRTGEGKDAVKDIPDVDLKRFPVENVSWDQCQIFVAKLNQGEKETGWVYRLPTETEWEYACRGGQMSDKLNSPFDFYFAVPTNVLLPEQANFDITGLKRTREVGTYEPNVLGLGDMHGNVWEWCEDGEKSTDGTTHRVGRGGCWSHDAGGGRAGFHNTAPASIRYYDLGLRLARVPSGAPSPKAQTPPLAADVLKDAVLLMNFEKDTFYEKDGKTHVRDLSGNGNDGLCENVEFTSDGKVGGGLACQGGRLKLPKSLINQQPNYTIAVWGRTKQLPASGKFGDFYITAAPRDMLPVFEIEPTRDRGLYITSWHRAKQPKNWVNFKTKTNQFTEEDWFFLAVTLSGGGVDKGDLRVTVNDLVTHGSIQVVEAPDPKTDFLGNGMTDWVLDEVAVFQRALTDEEIAAVRELGLQDTLLDGRKPTISVARQQVDEVRRELMRLNSGFDGKLTPTIENEVVTELSFNSDQVDNIAPVRALTGLIYLDCRGTYPNKGKLSDLSPIKGMKLSRIDCSSTQIADLAPLADMPLTFLQFNHNPVSDLTPLKNMPLDTLGCAETKVSDFSPLKGMKLKSLGAQLIPVTDLSPLQGMPLTGLDLYGTSGVTSLEPLKGMPLDGLNLQDVPVSDLSPLKGMTTLRTLLLQGCKVSDLSPLAGLQLTDLLLHDKQITDLSPLKGLPLTRLTIDGTGVSDLSPLQGMELVEFRLTPKNITQGLDILRGMQSLKTIGIGGAANQAWPAAEFWERYEKGEFME
jgi:formylglycine-generating enzyme required for sulfatase activity/Leucine-rich repeat (LRR) protein